MPQLTANSLAQGAAAEVRVSAQRLADGRTEFAVQQRSTNGEWSNRLEPSSRFLRSGVRADRWYTSTPVVLHDGSEVRVAAQPLSNGRIEFAVQQRLSDGEWSERLTPQRRFMPANARAGRWLSSSAVALLPPPSGSTSEQDAGDSPAGVDQSPPDPQAEQVYAWEAAMLREQLGELPTATFSIEQAQAIVDAIFLDHFNGNEDAPSVRVATLPDGISGRSDGQTIELDQQSINLAVLLHETAHALFQRGTDGAYACHCPEWAAQMLAIWDRYVVGFDLEAARRAAAPAGVSVAARALVEPTGDAVNLGMVRIAITDAFAERLHLFPEPPSDRNVLGYVNAPVTILEYSDYI